jgi:hypothetical protein
VIGHGFVAANLGGVVERDEHLHLASVEPSSQQRALQWDDLDLVAARVHVRHAADDQDEVIEVEVTLNPR